MRKRYAKPVVTDRALAEDDLIPMAGTRLRLAEDVPAAEASEVGAEGDDAGTADDLLDPMAWPIPAKTPSERSPAQVSRSGLFVEVVRLIIISVCMVSGREIGLRVGDSSVSANAPLVGILIGCMVGYFLGGLVGRRTADAMSELEAEFRRVSAAELLASVIGMIFGFVLAGLLMIPLFRLPAKAAYPTVGVMYLFLGFVGSRLGRAKSDELFGMFGVKPRAAGNAAGQVSILDSSALLDGRLVSMIRLGFLSGTLLVTRGVLGELQSVSDSSNAGRRARGRKALDSLVAMRRDPAVDIVMVEDVSTPGEPVDSQLVRLARTRGGVLITNDAGLARVAAALDVPVRSIHALAEALRPEVVAGEQVLVRLTRRGREAGQAVGYLEDGTMVVVEDADHLLGDTVSVTVTNALQTSTGRLIFARVAGDLDPD